MILTVCPSPCIDVNIEVDCMRPGRATKIISKKTFYTGKALNVAIGLARLKAPVFATGFMYEENGHRFERELHLESVPYKFVWNEGRVRENYKIIDGKSMLTEIDDVSSEINTEKQEELIGFVKDFTKNCDAIVLSGGLARGMTADFYGKILNAAASDTIKIVDTEGERLIESLKYGVKLVKPNREEIESTLKRTVKTTGDIKKACRQLLDMGTEYVLLSLGQDGAIITDGNKFYHCMSINVAKNSTIGAGDAMLAAASDALVRGDSLKDILRCGVAAGTAAVTLPDSISFTYEKYSEILSTLSVEEI